MKLWWLKFRAAAMRAAIQTEWERRTEQLVIAGRINAWIATEQKKLADINARIASMESARALLRKIIT